MRVLLDTNVVIDVLAHREPHFKFSQMVLLAIEEDVIGGYVSASAITDIFYIINKQLHDKSKTKELIKEHIISFVGVAAVDSNVISNALDIDWDDFEDAVQYSVGESITVDYIITRNPSDYAKSAIAVISPEDLLNMVAPESLEG